MLSSVITTGTRVSVTTAARSAASAAGVLEPGHQQSVCVTSASRTVVPSRMSCARAVRPRAAGFLAEGVPRSRRAQLAAEGGKARAVLRAKVVLYICFFAVSTSHIPWTTLYRPELQSVSRQQGRDNSDCIPWTVRI